MIVPESNDSAPTGCEIALHLTASGLPCLLGSQGSACPGTPAILTGRVR